MSKEATSAGAKLLCFPEICGYVGAKDGDSLKVAESLDGPIMQQYCSLARCGFDFLYSEEFTVVVLSSMYLLIKIKVLKLLFMLLHGGNSFVCFCFYSLKIVVLSAS